MNALSLLRLRKNSLWVGILGLYILVGVMCSVPRGSAIAIGVSFLLLLVAFSQLRFVELIVVFLVAESLVHLLKRAIFLFGPQPQWAYYGIQLVPTILFGIILIVTVQQLHWGKIPSSGKVLMTFLGLGLLTTLASPAGLPWIVRLAAIQQQLLPFLMFFVGITLSVARFARVGRTMALLAVISVVYGLIQFLGGPTLIDRAWASQTYAYSLQGSKVFAYLEGVLPEFRAFSYYADPLTWGLFLIAAFFGGAVARELGGLRTGYWRWVIVAVFIGLFLTLSRSPWVGFFAALLTYVLLGWQLFRRPWLIFGLVLTSFAVVVIGGNYLLQEFFVTGRVPLYENIVLARYLTLGTLGARTWAWGLFREIVTTNWLLGNGYGYSSYYAGRLATIEAGNVLHSHNFLVELVLYTGLPGLILFLGFYFQWLREGMSALHRALEEPMRKIIRWLIAFSVGFFVMGYFSGPSFMNYQFFLMMGILSGYTRQVKKGNHHG